MYISSDDDKYQLSKDDEDQQIQVSYDKRRGGGGGLFWIFSLLPIRGGHYVLVCITWCRASAYGQSGFKGASRGQGLIFPRQWCCN